MGIGTPPKEGSPVSSDRIPHAAVAGIPPRPLRGPLAPWRGRDGRGLPRPRSRAWPARWPSRSWARIATRIPTACDASSRNRRPPVPSTTRTSSWSSTRAHTRAIRRRFDAPGASGGDRRPRWPDGVGVRGTFRLGWELAKRRCMAGEPTGATQALVRADPVRGLGPATGNPARLAQFQLAGTPQPRRLQRRGGSRGRAGACPAAMGASRGVRGFCRLHADRSRRRGCSCAGRSAGRRREICTW